MIVRGFFNALLREDGGGRSRFLDCSNVNMDHLCYEKKVMSAQIEACCRRILFGRKDVGDLSERCR